MTNAETRDGSQAMKRSAVISECGRYRYRLDRDWSEGEPHLGLTWVMLNPSTADAEQDDPTIRRCIAFSKAWGYGSMTVVNVYAWRATDPRELKGVEDPFGPDWAKHIAEATFQTTVLAWGVHAGDEGKALAEAFSRQRRLFPLLSLGLTKDGHPRHPLYMRSDTVPLPFKEAS